MAYHRIDNQAFYPAGLLAQYLSESLGEGLTISFSEKQVLILRPTALELGDEQDNGFVVVAWLPSEKFVNDGTTYYRIPSTNGYLKLAHNCECQCTGSPCEGCRL